MTAVGSVYAPDIYFDGTICKKNILWINFFRFRDEGPRGVPRRIHHDCANPGICSAINQQTTNFWWAKTKYKFSR